MGTNFYLRRKEPTVKDTVHIGKRSWGWLFHWDSCDESEYPRWCDEDPSAYQSDSLPHSITCVDDIRAYLKTGEWELVDEYGEVYPDWEAEIDGFCNWDGGKSSYNKRHPDEPVTWEVHIPSGYHDKEGQIFDHGSGFC